MTHFFLNDPEFNRYEPRLSEDDLRWYLRYYQYTGPAEAGMDLDDVIEMVREVNPHLEIDLTR